MEKASIPLIDIFFHVLFGIVDKDKSGFLTAEELLECFKIIGIPSDIFKAKQMVACYDLDRSGSLQVDEFVTFMTQTYGKIRVAGRGRLKDESGAYWEIPQEGILKTTFVAAFQPPSIHELGSDDGVNGLLQAINDAPNATEKQRILELATNSCGIYFSADQTYKLMKACYGVFGKIDFLVKLLPHVFQPSDCSQIVDHALDINEKIVLLLKMGYLWRCVMGYTTGFYSLDLKDASHRLISKKVAERANAEKTFSRNASGRGDTSQHGNWENYRNGVLNQTLPLGKELTANWFAESMPLYGHMRFDYVSTTLPPKGMRPISDIRWAKFLAHINLTNVITLNQKGDMDDFLMLYGQKSFETIAEVEWRRLKESRLKKITPIEERAGMHMDPKLLIGTNPPSRRATHVAKASISESEVFDDSRTNSDVIVLNSTSPRRKTVFFGPDTEEFGGFLDTKALKTIQSGKELLSIPDADSAGNSSEASMASLALHPFFAPPGSRLSLAAQAAAAQDLGPTDLWRLCYFKLLQLQCSLCQVGLSVSQLVHLLQKFPRDDLFWVNIIVTFFNHVVDSENFHKVFDELTEAEYIEVTHRIGFLNLFNPVYPDRFYELNLAMKDHREVVAILGRLAMIEPGENLANQSYRRSYDIVPIPGWILPRPWAEDPENKTGKGLRDYGIIKMEYQSEGPGLEPNWQERKLLKTRVLCGSNRIY